MNVGEREYQTQRRVVEYFLNKLDYSYLGFLKDREDNSNVMEDKLKTWLKKQGHDERTVSRTLEKLKKALTVGGSRTLYDANMEVYSLLRYGVKVRTDIGEQTKTVNLIDWQDIEANHFGVAEEVTIRGTHDKRPDVVLYINGIAVGVLELKRSTVAVSEGIRQNLDNQKKDFIRPFFAAMQFVMAGNETEGLRYGTTETKQKYYLQWKEAGAEPVPGENTLLKELAQLCCKQRLLELMHDFVVFDSGVKKVCRHNQYFGVRAAQEYVRDRKGGIIWHTQGSGKSLTMVWLAKWIREKVTGSRVLVITDRTELDEQIEKVFKGVQEDIYRTKSGADMVSVLNSNTEWLICSLIHKFGRQDDLSDKDIKEYLKDIRKSLPKGFKARGELFVFVDECHRTQSGKLHEAMKTLLPDATFIGFTGTPLLSRDKKTSLEIFGPYIHTYKYDEAVRDNVVLDLQYEARDIDQRLTSQEKVDKWFEAKTRGLNDYARAQLKRRWGTMQKVLSSRDRLSKIVNDVLLDMDTQDRLLSGRGNAMLVSDSIYSACRFYQMFCDGGLEGNCAIITSYKPNPSDIKGEETGEGLTQKLLQYKIYRKMLADHFDESEEAAMYKTELFEQEVKKRFIEQPGQMKLLIVVDKLLTGFDAPPATYLYIDKHMQDHGLFQAICRVNRLDGDDKEYGHIIDYKDLFRSLEKSINDYTGGAFEGYDREDVDGLLTDRLEKGKQRLEEVRESIKALCEPVEPPYDTEAYLRFFVAADNADGESVDDNESKRITLYKLTSSFVRAYANLANEMTQAGYSEEEAAEIAEEVKHYESVRQEVKLNSGDYIDMKMYEPAMRHLLDQYIRAEDSESISAFDDKSLVELIVNTGMDAIDKLPEGIRNNQEAVAETIENNVRRLIIDEMAVNPKYYEKMSELLDDLIIMRKKQALDYRKYLRKVRELAEKVVSPQTHASYPASITTPGCRALYDNLDGDEELALRIDQAVRTNRPDNWRANAMKKKQVRNIIKGVISDNNDGDGELLDQVFELVKNQRDY
ncbi:Type-1 restriction enzyme R protein [Anaerohalosphaera lusitana]|uniref:Type I restriction enzyme endonuclease subunit n=1 Tax=Anaerohalosphaera lusitana TaxID=1936003 RepID=A0A1U9NQI8_9BACT|nr:HsdR family type I site-specific deoxyribonuclease [Anaerohalosphaera lusitana]AQT70085.1 Type-1 restriction enzyme R protein [Anaerohalosphaera lusitana]